MKLEDLKIGNFYEISFQKGANFNLYYHGKCNPREHYFGGKEPTFINGWKFSSKSLSQAQIEEITND